MDTKTCLVCKKSVENKRKYCSVECKAKSQKKTIELICVGCGAIFKILPYLKRKTNYCSVSCYHNSQRKKVTKTCPVCSKDYSVKLYLIKKGFGIHCSRKCFNKSLDARRKTQKCSFCSKEVTKAISVINKNKSSFCSKNCHDKSMREYIAITCANCQKEVEIPKSITNRGKGRFCSWYCYTHFKGETSIEKIVKNKLTKLRIPFKQEAKIGKYHADFLIDSLKTIIECDGDYWHGLPSAMIKDQKRDVFLLSKGYKVIRLSESEIKESKGLCVVKYISQFKTN